MYDSFHVSYTRRWDHDFPSRAETLDYLQTVLDSCVHRLRGSEPTPKEIYCYRHVTQHEYMHSENLAMVCQTLGYRRPAFPNVARGTVGVDSAYQRRDVEVPGASFPLGASQDASFVFDNEKWAHLVEIKPFRIANTPVTNAEFVEFVESGGYVDPEVLGKARLGMAPPARGRTSAFLVDSGWTVVPGGVRSTPSASIPGIPSST